MTFEEILDQAIAMLQHRGRVTYQTLRLQFQINYHPQSGWCEDAPLKGGAVVGSPLQRALLWHAPVRGAVAGSPLRGHCCRRPP
jgi:hypothetical protein